jgi:hypothetical protein
MANNPIELSERQAAVLVALHGVDRPASANVVAEAYAPGSDARGTAQTMRALRRLELVELTEEGYKFTKKGAAKVRRMVSA